MTQCSDQLRKHLEVALNVAQIHVYFSSPGVTYTSFAFLFRKTEYFKRGKKQFVQDLIPPLSMYIYMCTYMDICILRFSPFGLIWARALQVSHPDPWALIRVNHVQCVCVCVYTHTPTHIRSNPVKSRENIDNTPIYTFVQNNPPRQQQLPSID